MARIKLLLAPFTLQHCHRTDWFTSQVYVLRGPYWFGPTGTEHAAFAALIDGDVDMPVSLEVYHAGYDANKSPMRNAYMTYLVTPFTYMAIISGVMCYDRE
jgi:hypothetical protein